MISAIALRASCQARRAMVAQPRRYSAGLFRAASFRLAIKVCGVKTIAESAWYRLGAIYHAVSSRGPAGGASAGQQQRHVAAVSTHEAETDFQRFQELQTSQAMVAFGVTNQFDAARAAKDARIAGSSEVIRYLALASGCTLATLYALMWAAMTIRDDDTFKGAVPLHLRAKARGGSRAETLYCLHETA